MSWVSVSQNIGLVVGVFRTCELSGASSKKSWPLILPLDVRYILWYLCTFRTQPCIHLHIKRPSKDYFHDLLVTDDSQCVCPMHTQGILTLWELNGWSLMWIQARNHRGLWQISTWDLKAKVLLEFICPVMVYLEISARCSSAITESAEATNVRDILNQCVRVRGSGTTLVSATSVLPLLSRRSCQSQQEQEGQKQAGWGASDRGQFHPRRVEIAARDLPARLRTERESHVSKAWAFEPTPEEVELLNSLPSTITT